MNETLATRFAPVVQQLPLASFAAGPPQAELLIAQRGELAMYYAPFDHLNADARIVFVGITPGHRQMQNALLELRRQLNLGTDLPKALAAAQRMASFSGPMRKNLCEMLDYLQVQTLLGIPSCTTLFPDADQVHFTSLLRYPVFRSGCHYTGTPDMTKHGLLRPYLLEYFVAEADRLSSAIFVPLGPCVSATFRHLIETGLLNGERVLEGLENPSGANSERIAYFLERKRKEDLSRKTNPDRIDQAKRNLRQKIDRLFAASGK